MVEDWHCLVAFIAVSQALKYKKVHHQQLVLYIIHNVYLPSSINRFGGRLSTAGHQVTMEGWLSSEVSCTDEL